jgi:hypothetical protein
MGRQIGTSPTPRVIHQKPSRGCKPPLLRKRTVAFPAWFRTLSGRSEGEFRMIRSSPCLSASRCRSVGNELLPAFVPTITPLPLLRCGLVRPNCKSAWLRLLANGADGSRRTWTTMGLESSLFLQAIEMPRTKRTPNRKYIRIIKLAEQAGHTYLCSKSTGAVTSCTRKYLASAGYLRATASYIA